MEPWTLKYGSFSVYVFDLGIKVKESIFLTVDVNQKNRGKGVWYLLLVLISIIHYAWCVWQRAISVEQYSEYKSQTISKDEEPVRIKDVDKKNIIFYAATLGGIKIEGVTPLKCFNPQALPTGGKLPSIGSCFSIFIDVSFFVLSFYSRVGFPVFSINRLNRSSVSHSKD